jgi:hypothetical protein
MRKISLFCAVSALAMPAAIHAQETTATIRGQVTAGGAPVSDAEVSVVNVPSGTTSTVRTDAQGNFSAAGLRVGGPYRITVTGGGYQATVVENVQLVAGEPLRLPIELAAAGEEIVVTGARSRRETSNGPITALTREEIEGVASINRDIRDIARRDPFVNIDLTNSRTIEIAGQNGRLNRFSVDGVQFSDDFGLNNGGLPTSRGPVPFDAIEQLAVKVAPYDVQEGDFQGGAINVVLRSGTNRFSGSAFYTYSDDNLTGSETRGQKINLDFKSEQYGALLSGPIIKDRLFFMVAYERLKESDPFDDGVGEGFANQIPGLTIGQVNTVSEIAQSVYNYDTLGLIQNAVEEDEKIAVKLDVNITEGHRASLTYIRNTGTQQFQQNAFTTTPTALGLQSNGYELAEEVNSGVFQLNSQWSDTFSTELRASYRDVNRDQTPFGGRDFAQFEVCTDATSSGSVTSCAGPRVFFGPDVSRQSNDLNTDNLSIDFVARQDFGNHQVKFTAGYTDIDVLNLFLQRSLGDIYFDSIADFQQRRASRFRLGGAVPSLNPIDAAARFSTQIYTIGLQDDWDVTDTLQLSIGARYDIYHNPNRPPLNSNFFQRNGYSNRSTFSGRGAFQPRFGFNWQAADRLIIRGGVGIFAGGTPDVFLSNSFSNTGQLTNQIDISRQNPTGAPAGTTPVCNLAVNTPNRAAICNAALEGATGRDFSSTITNFLTTNTASLALAPVNAIDPDFDLPKQLRATLSANYEADLGSLGDGWLLGADLLYGEVLNGITYTDTRSVVIGTLPDGRPRYGPRGGVATTNQDLVLTNDNRGRSIIGVARVSKSWDWGLSVDASYTRSDIEDSNAVTSATAGSLYGNNAFLDPNFAALGTSIYQIKDQWKFSVDFRREFFGDAETRFSLFGEYRSGRPYSITSFDPVSGRSPVFGAVGLQARNLLYIPEVNDPRVSFGATTNAQGVVTQTAAQAQDLFNSLVEDLGLEKYRGRIVPKNSQQSPDFFKVDLHISQEIPVPVLSGAKVKLFADIENVLNLIDSDWGSLRQVAFPQTAAITNIQCLTTPSAAPIVVPVGTPPAQNPTGAPAIAAANSNQACAQFRYSNVVAPNETLQSRQSLYQVRVGIRFEF